jgi:hypothetical protein
LPRTLDSKVREDISPDFGLAPAGRVARQCTHPLRQRLAHNEMRKRELGRTAAKTKGKEKSSEGIKDGADLRVSGFRAVAGEEAATILLVSQLRQGCEREEKS